MSDTASLITESETSQVADQQQTAPTDAGNTGEQSAETTQQTEGQATESQPANGDKSEGDTGKPEGAPDKYEFVAPEGREFSPEVIAAYAEVAKELNLPQAQAQKVIDKLAPVMQAKQEAQLESIRTEWETAAHADKEFGGDKWEESIGIASKAFNQFSSPELRDLLNKSGLYQNPEIIRVFYKVGKEMSVDKVVGGTRAPSGDNDARSLYPNSNLK